VRYQNLGAILREQAKPALRFHASHQERQRGALDVLLEAIPRDRRPHARLAIPEAQRLALAISSRLLVYQFHKFIHSRS